MATEPAITLTAVDCLTKLREHLQRTGLHTRMAELTLFQNPVLYGIGVGFRYHGREFEITGRDQLSAGLRAVVRRNGTAVSVRLPFGINPQPRPVDGNYESVEEFIREVSAAAVYLLDVESKKLTEYAAQQHRQNQMITQMHAQIHSRMNTAAVVRS